jgi:hypothetical protein
MVPNGTRKTCRRKFSEMQLKIAAKQFLKTPVAPL